MAQSLATSTKSAAIVQELGTAIASEVTAHIEQREAQPDTITGYLSLDNETFKREMAGALINNSDGVPSYIIVITRGPSESVADASTRLRVIPGSYQPPTSAAYSVLVVCPCGQGGVHSPFARSACG